jgi:colanic acid/amylovoran biosynthesis glycosyltransferase
MTEVVIPKETGWLVPVRDPEALANAIVEIKDTSEAELQDITKNAHHFVQEHFNAEDSIQQFLELYESINLSET